MLSFETLFVTFTILTQGAIVLAAAPSVIFSCTSSKTAAITFDDGPWQYTKYISDTLTKAGAKGTFFLRGCIYDQGLASNVQYAYSKGHQIGSHTWSHKDLSTLSKAQIRTEMDKVDTALKKIIGVVPQYVRPPYGSYNTAVREVAGERNVKLVNWDLDSGDSVGASPQESKDTYQEFIDNDPNSMLALNHETQRSSAYEVLPFVINLLKSNGYRMVTVAECLGDSSPYLSVGSPTPRDGSWKC